MIRNHGRLSNGQMHYKSLRVYSAELAFIQLIDAFLLMRYYSEDTWMSEGTRRPVLSAE